MVTRCDGRSDACFCTHTRRHDGYSRYLHGDPLKRPLFAGSLTRELVGIIGRATAIFAATIGLLQNDIKKVLAYSTVSQLGYMFLGLGAMAYTASIFHVMTHAFFKALLFLGAGSVIHAMSDEQDIRSMGGLRKNCLLLS